MPAFTRSTLKFSKSLPFALFLALAPVALAGTWYVDGVNGNDSNNCQSRKHACKTIGHAISLSSPGGTIKVAPAIYTENLTIGISLNIIGSGAKTTIVDGGQADAVFWVSGTPVVLSRLTIQNGSGLASGGVYNEGTLTINESTVAGNNTPFCGGGINNAGTLTINNSAITGNNTPYLGGGICSVGALTINNSMITGNSAGGGGGVNNGGTFTVNRSTITANSAVDGGGVSSTGGMVAINSSTISGNSASAGGGIDIWDGTSTITNSTITLNNSNEGGGILNDGALTISNSTIAGNSSNVGGGITQGNYPGSSVTFQNSVIANNSGGNCGNYYGGGIFSNGYNLSSDGTCGFNGPGDIIAEPKLGKLGRHGGPTQTIPELVKSPTVDAGNPNGCTDANGNLLTTDQRGSPRPGAHKQDKRCDMGAFERQTD